MVVHSDNKAFRQFRGSEKRSRKSITHQFGGRDITRGTRSIGCQTRRVLVCDGNLKKALVCSQRNFVLPNSLLDELERHWDKPLRRYSWVLYVEAGRMHGKNYTRSLKNTFKSQLLTGLCSTPGCRDTGRGILIRLFLQNPVHSRVVRLLAPLLVEVLIN